MASYKTVLKYVASKDQLLKTMNLTVNTDECELFAGCKNLYGYGIIRHDNQYKRAHKLIYEAVKGSVPDGLILDHLCETPPCINPDHLEAVTDEENIRRHYYRRYGDFCKKGHPHSLYLRTYKRTRNGKTFYPKTCMKCHNDSERELYRKKVNSLTAERKKLQDA